MPEDALVDARESASVGIMLPVSTDEALTRIASHDDPPARPSGLLRQSDIVEPENPRLNATDTLIWDYPYGETIQVRLVDDSAQEYIDAVQRLRDGEVTPVRTRRAKALATGASIAFASLAFLTLAIRPPLWGWVLLALVAGAVACGALSSWTTRRWQSTQRESALKRHRLTRATTAFVQVKSQNRLPLRRDRERALGRALDRVSPELRDDLMLALSQGEHEVVQKVITSLFEKECEDISRERVQEESETKARVESLVQTALKDHGGRA